MEMNHLLRSKIEKANESEIFTIKYTNTVFVSFFLNLGMRLLRTIPAIVFDLETFSTLYLTINKSFVVVFVYRWCVVANVTGGQLVSVFFYFACSGKKSCSAREHR